MIYIAESDLWQGVILFEGVAVENEVPVPAYLGIEKAAASVIGAINMTYIMPVIVSK